MPLHLRPFVNCSYFIASSVSQRNPSLVSSKRLWIATSLRIQCSHTIFCILVKDFQKNPWQVTPAFGSPDRSQQPIEFALRAKGCCLWNRSDYAGNLDDFPLQRYWKFGLDAKFSPLILWRLTLSCSKHSPNAPEKQESIFSDWFCS